MMFALFRALSALVVLSGSVVSSANAGSLPPKKTDASKQAVTTCEINGKKGYRPAGSDTCVVVSGYVQATVGAKVH
jgi:hypothetical protein